MKRYGYKLFQDGMEVARVEAPTEKQAWAEINHYAMMYGQDGPVMIKRIHLKERKLV